MVNRQSLAFDNITFPANVIKSLGLDDTDMTFIAVRQAFAQFRYDAGASEDAVERVLLHQLYLAHLRSSQLHAAAEKTDKLEFKRLYTGAAARLMSEICKTAETISSLRKSRSRTKARQVPSKKRTSRTKQTKTPRARTKNLRIEKVNNDGQSD
jgi:hypothetical protein